MKKEKMMVIVLALLFGAMAVCGILTIRHFYSTYVSDEATPLSDLDLVEMVSYSCSGGSVAEQTFYFSLQKMDERILFTCDYFGRDYNNDDWKKYVVEDAELPAESFTQLMQLMANIEFPNENKKADDEILALDAETYSLTVYYASGKNQRFENYFSINEIEVFFRDIEIRDEWRID